MWTQLARRLSRWPTQAATCRRRFSAHILDKAYIVLQPSANSEALTFPAVWLRDNCSCSACFHASSQSRNLDWEHFDVSVHPLELRTEPTSQQLHVRWSDLHESSYTLDWLQQRSFVPERQAAYLDSFYRPRTRHWSGADFEHIMQRFDYAAVLQDEATLHAWLLALSIYGVALVDKAPAEQRVVRQLAERVGFIRRTTYGEEFVVQAKPGAKNFAYLSTPLPLHTDLPYYEYKPGVNLLHCLVQSESKGGSSLLVDGHYIADQLRAEQPAHFERLSQTQVDWNDIGSEDGREFHNIWRAPVICLDAQGRYTRINHSLPQRDSHFNVPLQQVLPWYESYARFVRLARENAHSFKLRPGEVLSFNNIRLLHGRSGYDDSAHNSRCVVGAYLDWDIIYSRLRVLHKRLAHKS